MTFMLFVTILESNRNNSGKQQSLIFVVNAQSPVNIVSILIPWHSPYMRQHSISFRNSNPHQRMSGHPSSRIWIESTRKTPAANQLTNWRSSSASFTASLLFIRPSPTTSATKHNVGYVTASTPPYPWYKSQNDDKNHREARELAGITDHWLLVGNPTYFLFFR